MKFVLFCVLIFSSFSQTSKQPYLAIVCFIYRISCLCGHTDDIFLTPITMFCHFHTSFILSISNKVT